MLRRGNKHGAEYWRRVLSEVKSLSLTTLREKLIKIGAKVVSHAKTITFQLAEVAVPREPFAAILDRIDRLRASPQAT
jgi:hypothetical protein